jgi:hypothetical protein
MKLSLFLSASVLSLAALSLPAQAEPQTCPDLRNATQVAACPTEAELKYTYMGFCGDNARLYGRDVLTCANFDNYREAKNIAMWESAGGAFSGYLSCNVSPESIKASAVRRMSVERKNNLTRLICDYENDHRLILRTKAQCSVAVEDCSTGTCVAVCE